jgi:tetratricopeptide (TPR) repeat protein
VTDLSGDIGASNYYVCMPQEFSPCFSTLFDRALHAAQTKNLAAAVELFDAAIRLESSNAAAHCNRGTVLLELNELPAALASYDRAIALKADYAVAYSNRGNVLRKLKRWDEALASYDRATAINPLHAEVHCNRGNVLKEVGRLEAALVSYNEAIRINSSLADAYSNRGTVQRILEQFDEALASYDRAIAINPRLAEAHCNRGLLLHDLGRHPAALQSFGHAIAIKPDFAEAHTNRSMTLLALGDYASGWLEYEWRWRTELYSREERHFGRPLWLGKESLAGKTILLHGEQGFGDMLQFCRYASLLAKLGAAVILEVPGPLKSLLASTDGVTRCIVPKDTLPEFDYHCPLMSLPLAFNSTLSNLPAHIPYLHASPEKTLRWQEKLGARRKPRIGLVWSGGVRPHQPHLWHVNRRRNIPLAQLAALLRPDMEFYSLQKGELAEAELAEFAAKNAHGPQLITMVDELLDFSDTAALVANLDLVVTVDTAMAHLAAALGKPVWILNRFDACWRWLVDRSDSPWYPTAKLYRQHRSGDWEGVLRQVAEDLSQIAAFDRFD